MIDPLFGPDSGVVFTTKFPSMSLSPASVKSPIADVFSTIVCISLSTIGASFTGFTVMNKVSFTHSTGSGVPLSHTTYGIVSIPLKSAGGV